MSKLHNIYAGLAARFAHLSLNAKEDDEDKDPKDKDPKDKGARADDDQDDKDKDGKDPKGKKSKARADGDDDGDDGDDGDGGAKGKGEKDDEDKTEGKRKAAATARAEENTRWTTVLSSPEAKGRVAQACTLLAGEDYLSAEKIRGVLASMPSEIGVQGAASAKGLAARMAEVARPDVGAPPAAAPVLTGAAAQAASMLASYKQATGG